MRSIAIAVFSAAFCRAIAASAVAGEEPVQLKKGPGLDKVQANCAVCHTLDYIRMNSPFLNAAGWEAEVTKMISAFGAPISPDDAKIIGDYLKANYGQ
jgi:sulfite dehydrogenase (cytochrome) subunit B